MKARITAAVNKHKSVAVVGPCRSGKTVALVESVDKYRKQNKVVIFDFKSEYVDKFKPATDLRFNSSELEEGMPQIEEWLKGDKTGVLFVTGHAPAFADQKWAEACSSLFSLIAAQMCDRNQDDIPVVLILDELLTLKLEREKLEYVLNVGRSSRVVPIAVFQSAEAWRARYGTDPFGLFGTVVETFR